MMPSDDQTRRNARRAGGRGGELGEPAGVGRGRRSTGVALDAVHGLSKGSATPAADILQVSVWSL